MVSDAALSEPYPIIWPKYQVSNLHAIPAYIENWYEERLYLEQTYRRKPDLKIVSVEARPNHTHLCATDINSLIFRYGF